MKDHEIAQLVNALTEVGRDYGQTQQLRDRISGLVVPAIRKAFEAGVAAANTNWSNFHARQSDE